MTTNVLILCTHNSARSVLSEGMLNHWAKKVGRDVNAYNARSATSGRVNPYAIEALGHVGVDVSDVRSIEALGNAELQAALLDAYKS